MINPATLTVSGAKVYDSTSGFTVGALSVSGGVNGETVTLTSGSGTTTSANAGSYAGSSLAGLSISVSGGNALASNYQLPSSGTLTITPATLTYAATPATGYTGSPLPPLTGTVTGFLGFDTLASATSGAVIWTTTATLVSPVGSYPIDGSGLTANFGNYVFVQAAGNATALSVGTALPNNLNPSHFNGSVNGNTPNNNVNITFNSSNPNNFNLPGLIHISFTPDTTISPAGLPPGNAFTRNGNFDFQPISEFDPNQYSQFKLPDYDNDDAESAIFTILARAASPGHGADYLIDNFWSGSGPVWPGANGSGLDGKVTFSNGAGQDVTPAGDNAFPIVAGKTDLASLLKNGPVMIGGPAGQTPPEWLLAVNMAPDGKGIICDDPITGKLVELAYDPATETLGGITGIFDPKTKGFVSLADAGGDIPPGAAGDLSILQNFVPFTFFAVTGGLSARHAGAQLRRLSPCSFAPGCAPFCQ